MSQPHPAQSQQQPPVSASRQPVTVYPRHSGVLLVEQMIACVRTKSWSWSASLIGFGFASKNRRDSSAQHSSPFPTLVAYQPNRCESIVSESGTTGNLSKCIQGIPALLTPVFEFQSKSFGANPIACVLTRETDPGVGDVTDLIVGNECTLSVANNERRCAVIFLADIEDCAV